MRVQSAYVDRFTYRPSIWFGISAGEKTPDEGKPPLGIHWLGYGNETEEDLLPGEPRRRYHRTFRRLNS